MPTFGPGPIDSELPAAAALADAAATPTVPAVGAFTMVYNGATWDMLRGSAALGVTVNSELPAAAALTDADANPTVPGVGSYLMGWDPINSTWRRFPVYREDDGHVSGHPGLFILGVRNDGNSVLAGTDLDYSPVRVSPRGDVVIAPEMIAQTDGSSNAAGALNSASNATVALASNGFTFNGSTWDRQRNNMDAVLLASAARTITTASADQTNYNGSGVIVVLDMSVIGTGSVTLTIQGKDSISGNYYTLLAGAAVVGNSTNAYTVYPAAPATANVSANAPLPRTWRINVVANNANSATYSVSASVIL